jgi:putative hemolysin
MDRASPDFHDFQASPSERLFPGETLAAKGSLEARLARNDDEIQEAQRLRYQVFYAEGGAVPDARAAATCMDADKFDEQCDHLIVLDRSWENGCVKGKPKIVGAYRLLRGDRVTDASGFYSAGEYDIAPLLKRHADRRILELGRSCVMAAYRNKPAIELLWRGLLAYIRRHRIDVLIGCASFPGVVPGEHAEALSYLAHYAGAEGEWRVRALCDLYRPMAIVTRELLDERRARQSLSPLIKGYLRLGARFGDGAVVDSKFNTTDVFVVMPVDRIDLRYIHFFGERG